AERDQRVDAADHQPVDELLDQGFHAALSKSAGPGPRAGRRPGGRPPLRATRVGFGGGVRETTAGRVDAVDAARRLPLRPARSGAEARDGSGAQSGTQAPSLKL